jgi:fatty acid-binding protein DegV
MMEFYPYFLFLGVRISFNSCIIRALPSYAHLWEGGRISRLEGVIVLILR